MSLRNALSKAWGSNPLPEGTLAVGVGLLINGVCSYGFLAVSGRVLGPVEYAPLATLWAVIFVVGPGFFLPLEQEVSRALAARRGRGVGGGPVLRRAAVLGGILAAALVVVTIVLGPLMTTKLFNGEWVMVAALAIGQVAFYVTHLARGGFSGLVRFRAYSTLIAADGALRFVFCVALAVIGFEVAGPYGVGLAIAPILAVAVSLRGQRDLVTPGPDAPWSELSTALGWLLFGSVLAQTLPNIPVVAVELLSTPDQAAAVSEFQVGLIVARVPLFLFLAVQAALLPKLSALAGAGRIDEFKTGFRRLVAVVVGIGAIGTLAAFTIGPWVVRLLFGPEFDLDSRTLGLLALGSALYMLAVAMAQAVIALHGHARQAFVWLAGVIVFIVVVTAMSGSDLFLRAELGLVAGAGAAAAGMAWVVVERIRSGAVATSDSIVEAIHDVALEP
jgi:O-antigen/teichoic acid export membrane protein